MIGSILHALGIRGQLVAVQLFGFLLVFAVLKTLLFDRVDQALADRAAEEARRRDVIAAGTKHVAAATAKLSARNAEIEKQGFELAQVEVRAGMKKKTDATAAANEQARIALVKTRETHAKQHDQALERLAADVRDLTLSLAAKATERDVAKDARWTAIADKQVAAVMADWDKTRAAAKVGGAAQ